MNGILLLAALVSLVIFFVHWLIGGIYAARPLLAAKDISPASRWLNYLCWHIVTILLLIITATLGLAALGRASADTVILVAVIAASSSILSVAVTLRAGIRPYRFPASYLLATVAVLSTAGIL